MKTTKYDSLEFHSGYSTTRRLIKANQQYITELMKQADKAECKFDTVLFLPECQAEDRIGEGGLRTHGYFKVNKGGNDNVKDEMPSEKMHKPLITIISVVFNGEKFFEDTILSILNQSYDNVEYIIIDGGSTDGTIDIIKKYEYAIDYWVSEKDKGIYYAMNKGIALATGKWINFMNGGDVFFNHDVCNELFSSHIDMEVGVIYGRSISYYKKYEKLRFENFYSQKENFYLTRMPNHQAVFIESGLCKAYRYNTDFDYFADTIFLRSCFESSKRMESELIISKFELGGVSNYYGSFKNFKLIANESCILHNEKLQPYMKHGLKFLLQKILGKDLYLKFYFFCILK